MQSFTVLQEDPPPRRPDMPAPSSAPIEFESYTDFTFRLSAIVMNVCIALPERVDVRPFTLEGKSGGSARFDSVGLGLQVGLDITFDMNLFRFFTEATFGGSETDSFALGAGTGTLDYGTYAVRIGLQRPLVGLRAGSLRATLGPGVGFYNLSAKSSSDEVESRRHEFNGFFVRAALNADVRLFGNLYLMTTFNADLLTLEARGVPLVITFGLVVLL